MKIPKVKYAENQAVCSISSFIVCFKKIQQTTKDATAETKDSCLGVLPSQFEFYEFVCDEERNKNSSKI